MSKVKREIKKEEKEIGVEGLFSGIGKMISSVLNLADKMMKEGKSVAERKGEIEAKIGGKPARISYGYRVGIGLRPGIRKAEEKPIKILKKAIEKWKPVLDIFENPKEIKVVAELPKDVKKKDIEIKMEGDKLKIITPRYSREAKLPCSVGKWSFKLYKTKLESLLEIKLRKRKK